MRTRHQDGWIELRGTRQKRWYGNYTMYIQDEAGKEKRRHRGVYLGDKAKMRKWEAEEKLRGIIASTQKSQPVGNSLTLAWYTKERFLPMREPQWAPSTRETNLYNIRRHILSALGETVLADLDKFACQVFLNDLAKDGFSFTVVDHCRTMLKAILEEAVDAELLERKAQAGEPGDSESEKPVLPKLQAHRLLDALPLRDRLMAMIAAFCAMRPGEIFGLRWSSWRGDHFQIEGTAWRGTLRPGKAKTRGSKAPVVIPNVLQPLLTQAWRDEHKAAPSEALIFPSKKSTKNKKGTASEKETPMRPENWLRRRIKPIAAALGTTVQELPSSAENLRDKCARAGKSERRAGASAPLGHHHYDERIHPGRA